MSDFDEFEIRPLKYPLQTSEEIEAETPDDATPSGVFVWPDDPDEKTYVLFHLSQHEYTALSSAVDVGRDIAYGLGSTAIWWLWIRNMVQVPEICAMVADCFANDAAFRESVINSLKNDPVFQQTISEMAGRSTGPQIEGELFGGDCDNDVVAGRVIAIVGKLNTRNVDFLEIVEVGTNDEERVSSVLAAIPILGESPVDEVIDIIQGFLEDFTENYNAAITEDWLKSVYEDLNCIAHESETCSLTFQQLFDYFATRSGSSLTIGSVVSNIFSFIVNGDFSTDDLIASGMFTIQLAFILAGLEFNGMSVPTMGAIARDADPSGAWVDWEPCGSEIWDEFDFATCSMFSFYAAPGYATFDCGWKTDTDPLQIAFKRPHLTYTYTTVELFFQSASPGMAAMSLGNENATGFQVGTTSDNIKWVWAGHTWGAGWFFNFYNAAGLSTNKILKVRALRA